MPFVPWCVAQRGVSVCAAEGGQCPALVRGEGQCDSADDSCREDALSGCTRRRGIREICGLMKA